MERDRKIAKGKFYLEIQTKKRRKDKIIRSKRKSHRKYVQSRSKHWKQADNFKLEDYMNFN